MAVRPLGHPQAQSFPHSAWRGGHGKSSDVVEQRAAERHGNPEPLREPMPAQHSQGVIHQRKKSHSSVAAEMRRIAASTSAPPISIATNTESATNSTAVRTTPYSSRRS